MHRAQLILLAVPAVRRRPRAHDVCAPAAPDHSCWWFAGARGDRTQRCVQEARQEVLGHRVGLEPLQQPDGLRGDGPRVRSGHA